MSDDPATHFLGTSRSIDPEIQTIEFVMQALAQHDEETVDRILNYLAERYAVVER